MSNAAIDFDVRLHELVDAQQLAMVEPPVFTEIASIGLLERDLLIVSTLNFESLNIALPSGFTEQDLKNLFVVLGAVFAAFGVIAIIGGVFAVERKHFAMTIIGGIFGIVAVGFLLGALLALIGLILVVMSRHEFRQAAAPLSA